ncbi:hypothetical protein BH23CHL5_BH23CHL5_01380 [soil metagenome]
MVALLIGLSFIAGFTGGLPGLAVVTLVAGVAIAVRRAWVLATFVICVAGLGLWRSPGPLPTVESGLVNGTRSSTGEVISHPLQTSSGTRFRLRVQGDQPYNICVIATGSVLPQKGEVILLRGEESALRDLPENVASALYSQRCAVSLTADQITVVSRPSRGRLLLNDFRRNISSTNQQIAPGDTGALMTGLVTGDDSGLSFNAAQAFRQTGTTHITAVSGSNFAVLVAIAVSIAGTTGARRRADWIGATAALIWFYAILVDLSPSAVRAAIMATLALGAMYFGRRADFLTLLVLCAVLQLAARPDDWHTLSFRLSFAATLGLVLVFSTKPDSRERVVLASVKIAFAAFLATTPILVSSFGLISLSTVPTNVLIAPLVVIAFPMTLIANAAGVVYQPAAIVLGLPGSWAAAAIIRIVRSMDSWLPGSVGLGSTSPVQIAVVAAVCWSIVLAMSYDARLLIIRFVHTVKQGVSLDRRGW